MRARLAPADLLVRNMVSCFVSLLLLDCAVATRVRTQSQCCEVRRQHSPPRHSNSRGSEPDRRLGTSTVRRPHACLEVHGSRITSSTSSPLLVGCGRRSALLLLLLLRILLCRPPSHRGRRMVALARRRVSTSCSTGTSHIASLRDAISRTKVLPLYSGEGSLRLRIAPSHCRSTK